MPRAATTTDVFNAVAEPRRRQLLNILKTSEYTVTELVERTRLDQPSTSKHLNVLLRVGLVDVHREGRHMIYSLNPHALRPIHDWTTTFESLWSGKLLNIKQRAEQAARKKKSLEEK
jgi:DNA-binding transcriptional ArsR family regulator